MTTPGAGHNLVAHVAPRHVGEVTGAQEARGRPLRTPSHPSRAARTPVRERGHNFWGRGHNFKRQYLRTARTVCHDSKLERRLKTPREGIMPSPRPDRLRGERAGIWSMWDYKNDPKLSNSLAALGGLSAVLGGLSQLRHKTKLGNCGLSQAIAD